jgi:hypothetical protein
VSFSSIPNLIGTKFQTHDPQHVQVSQVTKHIRKPRISNLVSSSSQELETAQMIELRLPGTFHFNTFWSPRARRCRQVTIAAASSDAAKFDQPCEKRAINAPELGPWNAPEKIARHFQKKNKRRASCVRAGRLPAGAGEATDVGGREEVDDGAEDLVREHGEGAERRLPPALDWRFHR